MKGVFCTKCYDIVFLRPNGRRTCECKQSWGEYVDDLNAKIGGPCVPIGFSNKSFVHALKHRPEYGKGKIFESFIIPVHCPTIEVEKVEVLTKGKR